jgi:hypothetical protein
MIIVKIELHSAITGKVSEIGRMDIWNEGTGTEKRGNYGVGVHRRHGGRMGKAFQRKGQVQDYPRLSYNIWRLVSRAIRSAFPEEK